MSEPRGHDVVERSSRRLPSMLQVGEWQLLTVCVLLLAIFALRQTGSLPGQTIRVLDVVLVAASLGLSMHAAKIRAQTQMLLGSVAGVSIVLTVISVSTSSVTLQRVVGGISAVVLTATFVFILLVVLRQRHVTADTLFGALGAYLCVALIFALIYTVIARTDPGAFEPPQQVLDGQTDLYYFSFVTLTSLGYGDISPASDLTRILAPIEAVLGAILIAALVGRIVGLLVGQTTSSDTQQQLEALTRAVERLDPSGSAPDPPEGDDQSPG